MSVFPSFSAGADIVFGSLAQSSKINDIKSPIETFISALAGGSVPVGDHTTPTTVTANKNPIIYVNASGGNAVVNLCSAASHTLFPITIKKIDNSSNTVTINRDGSDTIENPDATLTTPTATSIVLRFGGEEITIYPRSIYWQLLNKIWYVPSVRAYKDDAQTITTTATTVAYNVDNDFPTSAAYDNYGLFNSSTGVFTAPRDGTYLVRANVTVSTSATAARLALNIRRNTTVVAENTIPAGGVTSTLEIITPIAGNVRVLAGDTIDIQAFLTAGSRSLFSSGANRQRYTFVEIDYINKAT